jgi:hypothetical protein
MHGMNAETGAPLSGIDHLTQSISDILSTPIGTRVMLREYGSRLPDLLDQPMVPGFAVEVTVAVAEALARWEKRFALSEVAITEATAGRAVISLTGIYKPSGQTVTVDGVVIGEVLANV